MNNAHYSGGYLHRGFAIKSVNKAQGPPDIEELQRFNQVRIVVILGSRSTHTAATCPRDGPAIKGMRRRKALQITDLLQFQTGRGGVLPVAWLCPDESALSGYVACRQRCCVAVGSVLSAHCSVAAQAQEGPQCICVKTRLSS